MFLDCWKTLDLFKETSLKTPRVKLSATESNAIENSSILEGERATLFRSGNMRCAYLAQDRADISEAIKCLARGMSKPRTGHMIQLKRVARYLKGVPRKAQQCPAQEKGKAHLEVHVDCDWSGDTVTRRSTTGVIVRRGQHLLSHSSTVQNVIGLSSAESEYCALAYRFFECKSKCFAKRNWQEHSSHTDKDAMAARTRSSKTLTSCESSIRIKSCRHVDESPWKIKN